MAGFFEVSAYSFQIIASDGRILDEQIRDLPDIPAVWSELVMLTWRVQESGVRMEVRDQTGDAIIRVGIATARATAEKVRAAA